MRRPTLASYDKFRSQYPGSPLLEQLRPTVENLAFDSARRAGTAAAYAAFEERFPKGPHASRMRGNVAYLSEIDAGIVWDPAALSAFAATHPESDYADEARRSVEALAVRDRSSFATVLLEIDLAEGMPDADRIRAAFVERAVATYRDAGIQLLVAPPGVHPAGAQAILKVWHREETETVPAREGDLSAAGLIARTEVTLKHGRDSTVIWRREFIVRVPPRQVISGASALFASTQAELYWDDFFVPVATWDSNVSLRHPVEMARPVAAVDAAGGRAVVLSEEGSFDFFDLADPEHPLLVARHERGSNLERFDGVRIHEDRILVYGDDGLEIVAFGADGLAVVATHSRDEIGSISALHPIREGLLLASSRGLLLTNATGANARVLMRRSMSGIGGEGDVLVLADGENVYVSTLDLLKKGRVLEQFRLGRTFAPKSVRLLGDIAVVMGQGGAVLIEVPATGMPRMLSRFERSMSGEVRDAVRVEGRIHLLGSRGLMLLDRDHDRIVEFVDVAPRRRVARTGRHLVAIGDRQLQVIDVLPFTSRTVSPARAADSSR